MLFDPVLKKTSALLAAMLLMTAAWCFLHLPGASMQMATFAFLSSAALSNVPDLNSRIRRCIEMVCGTAAMQFFIGCTADYPLVRLIVCILCSFIILTIISDRQSAIIILLGGFLTLFTAPGVTASLNRALDLAFAGVAVLLVTTLCNIFVTPSAGTIQTERPYTLRQKSIITAELAAGFVISLFFKHEQSVWIMLTILFIHMAENPQTGAEQLTRERIAATPAGILLGGIYLAAFCSTNYRMIYVVPFAGTLSFFVLYLKNNYFLFTLLFMFTLTLFTDWMLGTGSRFHFTEIMFVRSIASVIGGLLLLCGKNFMQKDMIS